MDCLARLRQLMDQQQMSEYRLSQTSGIPLSTINSLFHKGNSPTIPTLEGLCRGLNITLSEFFFEPGNSDDTNVNHNDLPSKWNQLTKRQQAVLIDFMDLLLDEK